jgi:lipopolysaccharide heptosyltransferase II
MPTCRFPFTAYRLPFTVYRSLSTQYLPAVHHISSAPNILAVRFSSIGDVLLTTPLLRAIRQRHPQAAITVLTKPAHAPLLSHNPHVTRVLSVESKGSLRHLAGELRAARYSDLLDLHDSLRSRMLRLLVPGNWTSYPKHRVARALLIHAKKRYRSWRPVAERYFAAAQHLDVKPDGRPPEFFLGAEARQEIDQWLGVTGLAKDRSMIAVAPGAAHATKRWPVQHWQALIDRIIEQGQDVVIVGGAADQEVATALTVKGPGRVVSAAGRFGLQGTGALIQRSTALVSGDTGVMHMATGVGTPVVALFGPTVKEFGFFPYTPGSRVIELDLSCRPCSSKGGPRCPLGHHRCLVDIGPETVLAALNGSWS